MTAYEEFMMGANKQYIADEKLRFISNIEIHLRALMVNDISIAASNKTDALIDSLISPLIVALDKTSTGLKNKRLYV